MTLQPQQQFTQPTLTRSGRLHLLPTHPLDWAKLKGKWVHIRSIKLSQPVTGINFTGRHTLQLGDLFPSAPAGLFSPGYEAVESIHLLDFQQLTKADFEQAGYSSREDFETHYDYPPRGTVWVVETCTAFT